jgi:transcriptional regulator with AAA-type ATPase domain
MNSTHGPQHDQRRGDGRPAGHLIGREAQMDRLRAFLATPRTDGEAMLVTGEPGRRQSVRLDVVYDGRCQPNYESIGSRSEYDAAPS